MIDLFFPLDHNDRGFALYARVETGIGRADIPLDSWPDSDELLHSRCSRFIIAGLELDLRLLQKLDPIVQRQIRTGTANGFTFYKGINPIFEVIIRGLDVGKIGRLCFNTTAQERNGRLDFAIVGCAVISYYRFVSRPGVIKISIGLTGFI